MGLGVAIVYTKCLYKAQPNGFYVTQVATTSVLKPRCLRKGGLPSGGQLLQAGQWLAPGRADGALHELLLPMARHPVHPPLQPLQLQRGTGGCANFGFKGGKSGYLLLRSGELNGAFLLFVSFKESAKKERETRLWVNRFEVSTLLAENTQLAGLVVRLSR